jgi:hypothetical protein
MSENNIPYLSQNSNFGIVILTTEESVNFIEEQPIIEKIKKICSIQYIFIEDLIFGKYYGVTLTLAYARGIKSFGSEQINTYFIFMNSDFILSDGSLRALFARFEKGQNCVIASTLRSQSEPMMRKLQKFLSEDKLELSITSRYLVGLAFEHLHPTLIAKTVTQSFVTCWTHNHIYWQVDKNTLLCRSHLNFMLAIKPEVPLGAVNSFCDYGFVPELVPSGAIHMVEDSDEILMLELQATDAEKEFIRLGVKTPAEMAKELAAWTTKEHRYYATVNVVFHSQDLPKLIDNFYDKSEQFMRDLHLNMPPSIDPMHHDYWTGAFSSWWSEKKRSFALAGLPPPQLPSEVCETSILKRPSFVRRLLNVVRRFVIESEGKMPSLPVWHSSYLDSQLLMKWVKAAQNSTRGSCLVVYSDMSDVATQAANLAGASVQQGVKLKATHPNHGTYEQVLLVSSYNSISKMGMAIEKASNFLSPSGSLSIFIFKEDYHIKNNNMTDEIPLVVEKLFYKQWMGYHLTAQYVGGFYKYLLSKLTYKKRLMINFSPNTKLIQIIFQSLGWGGASCLVAVNNLIQRKKTTEPAPCLSSVMLTMTPIKTSNDG